MSQNKPIYYDGSVPVKTTKEQTEKKPLVITAEMRKKLGGNPYVFQMK